MEYSSEWIDQCRFVKHLGDGKTSTVSLWKHPPSKTFHAFKKVSSECEKEGIPTTIIREVALLKHLYGHSNIISLNCVHIIDTQIILVLEYVPWTLRKLISCEDLSFFMVQSIMHQLLCGVAFMHHKNIAHRDLKPENILLQSSGLLKIADLGQSALLTPHQVSMSKLSDHRTTVMYRAPEMLLGDTKYTHKVDMWAVGCIFAELMTKKTLFPALVDDPKTQLSTIVKVLGPPTLPQDTYLFSLPRAFFIPEGKSSEDIFDKIADTPEGVDLLKGLLKYNPETRFSAKEALAHEYFKI